MKSFAVVVAFALLLLAAAAAYAPATLLDMRLEMATQGQLRLVDTAGSVWNGRGLVTNAQRTWSLPVGWSVDPLALARGDMLITLRAAEGGDLPRGNVAWRSAALAVEGLAFTLPATALNAANALGGMVALGGYVGVDAPHMSWSENGGDGAATARWTGARLATSAGTLGLGTVTANLVPRNGRIEGRIENRGGEVRIDGEFAWTSTGSEINATLSGLPSTPPAVVRALGALGTPDANGAVHLQWRSGTH